MQTNLKSIQPSLRPIDPNVRQRRASDPAQSVWVSASAGSGKTKVLTDRVLRLLLPDKNGLNATDPAKILAITFTKAAAAEMALRIQKTLSEWAVIKSDEALSSKLEKLLGHSPTEKQIKTAQRLFADVIDVPGGLKIMTIHSFCQSILGRFPMEAGLSPNFQALEESEAHLLLNQAYQHMLRQSEEEKGSPLSQAFFQIALAQNEEQFDSLIDALLRERKQLTHILNRHFDIDGLYTAICQSLNIQAGLTEEEIIKEACHTRNFNEDSLRKCCKALSESGKKDQEKAIQIQNWLDQNTKDRQQDFELYRKIYFTSTGDILKTLAHSKALKIELDADDILREEATRLLSLHQTLLKIKIATNTQSLFLIGHHILEQYQALKSTRNALDYDDLILTTLALLQGNTTLLKGLDVTPWIRFKLDQGIDHILVDEAQDTNPEQWEIIRILCDDFFDQEEEEDKNRTLFVVGDEKQSIYSFQRAAPEKFNAMQKFFKEKIDSSAKKFEEVDFVTSFRSVPAILSFVDAVFTDEPVKKGLGHHPIYHESFDTRRHQPGLVELWPLFKTKKEEIEDPWHNPFQIKESQSGAGELATHIGDTIKEWLDKKRLLYSYDRPVEPQDILILVRTRTAFMDQLVRALKIRNIPVSGVDRMRLNTQLAVEDMMAAAQFALLPIDDLTLATLLKSPFIGLNEEALFDLCYNRPHTLWESVQEKLPDTITQWLSMLIQKAGTKTPYAFFLSLIQNPCPANDKNGLCAIQARLGKEALDPIEEFLNQCLEFEKNSINSLQLFTEHHRKHESDIKRELEKANDAVRIMTVHGAKGLQAPIVIMPDTIRHAASIKKDRILWPDKTNAAVPYFCPRVHDAPIEIAETQQKLNDNQNEEYRRLFYVAATRAESELYIGGYTSESTKPLADSWYNYTQQGLEKLDIAAEDILRFTNPATGDPDRREASKKQMTQTAERPNWLFSPMPEEPSPPRPLTPSRPSGSDKEKSLSPLQRNNIDEKRFKRGNIIHKLLQVLPDTPPSTWDEKITYYLAQPVHELKETQQQEIKEETLSILHDTLFSPIFGAESKAEVPISGLLNDKTLINGQIDRLLVTDNEVYIIDYKTNRPPPKDVKDVPAIYINQMNTYENAIRQIYPDHKIHKALLWTNDARLMHLP